ncbi:hypothetical protein SprV_0100397300 [Sparganum proliferum]
MDFLLNCTFKFLECPRLKLKKPSWLTLPPPMVVFMGLLTTYFLVTGGVVFDVINGPPSVGTETDAKGNQRPITRVILMAAGVTCMLTSLIATRSFMKIKLPSYRF